MSIRPLAPVLLATVLLLIAGPAPAEETTGKALDEYFKGEVVSFDRGVLTLRYDFSDEAQKEDWFEGVPFPVKRRDDQGIAVVDGALEVKGSTGVRHQAAWAKDIQVTAKLTMGNTRDIGGMLTPDEETNDFATFTVREFYFHSWDHGQKGGQHSIIKFGDQWREDDAGDEFVGFRYVARRKAPKPVIEGRKLDLAFGLKRGKLTMEVQEVELKGKDLGKKLKIHRPGFYTVKGKVLVDNVVITGTLDKEWMALYEIEPRLANPPSSDGE